MSPRGAPPGKQKRPLIWYKPVKVSPRGPVGCDGLQGIDPLRGTCILDKARAMSEESERQASAEIEVTPAMVRAFQCAYLEWENGPNGWSYSTGLERILSMLLREALEDMRSLVCADRHTDHKFDVSDRESARR